VEEEVYENSGPKTGRSAIEEEEEEEEDLIFAWRD
jgi:hypothetical protein